MICRACASVSCRRRSRNCPVCPGAWAGRALYIKRDDQTGLATGGNKTRKLEFLVGDALAQGCDTLVTGGAMQSNHCRQTAAAAAASGLECHLVLGGDAPREPGGNVLLDLLLGATIHWCGERTKGEDIPRIAESLRAAGRRPYVVPYGGSNPVGAAGFVAAAAELKEQAGTLGVRFTHIVFASSSGGTQAGLVVGNALLGLGADIVGIGIDKWEGEPEGFAARVRDSATKSPPPTGWIAVLPNWTSGSISGSPARATASSATSNARPSGCWRRPRASCWIPSTPGGRSVACSN